MKIAIVHDYLHTFGGAERVLVGLHETYPEAPIFTSVYYKEQFPGEFKTWNIHTSFLQKFPKSLLKFFKPFYPLAFKSFNFKSFDIIISSTAGMAKGITKPKGSIHVSYIHTVPRAIINIDNRKGVINKIISFFYKIYDLKAAKSVDFFIANSITVQKRIKKYYNKNSVIINPPVEIAKLKSYLQSSFKSDYFVMIGRLESYKGTLKVAKVIEKLGLKLKVIGSGPQSAQLQQFGLNIEYLGNVNDAIKANILYNSLCLIFWAFEDFGITIAESVSLGVPVIAFEKGGSTEILNDSNSVFFNEQSEESLEKAIKIFETKEFNKSLIMENSLKYSKENFIKNIKTFIESL